METRANYVLIGAFTLATFLIGRLGAVQLAGHQIALNVASITFMVPMGIGSAAAVRVGQAIGARDVPAASRAGPCPRIVSATPAPGSPRGARRSLLPR